MRVPRYCGVLNEEDGVDTAALLRKDSRVAFEWCARGEDDETSQRRDPFVFRIVEW